jgi:hypothetical protein
MEHSIQHLFNGREYFKTSMYTKAPKFPGVAWKVVLGVNLRQLLRGVH